VPSGALDLGLGAEKRLSIQVDSIPAVMGAAADSAAAALALTSARRGRLPVPSLLGGTEWDDPADPGRGLSVIGFTIPLPFWNVGSAQVAAARARAERAAADLGEVRLEATRSIADALIRVEESASRAQFARDSLVPAARELRLRAVAAYRAGETGVLPVLDALRGERDIRLAGVQDLLAFQVALANWRALLGRPE
jgi:cobalt-zinc-cadmium efflux system outer membrane protein